MAEPSRGLQISRRRWLLAGLVAPLFSARAAESLGVIFDGDNLHPSVPDLHFLEGKPLERLKDGSTVVYQTNLTLYRDSFLTQWKRAEARFDLSYDILGEGDKFTATMQDGHPRRAENLTRGAAEAWCLDNIFIAAAGIPPDRQFWMQLEVRAGSPRKLSNVLGDGGIKIDIIEWVSTKPGSDAPLTRRGGPFRLADLVRTPVRGRNE